MLPVVILGLALLVGAVLLLYAFAQADVRALARGIRRSGAYVAAAALAAIVLWLVVTGRVGGIMAVASALLPVLPLLRRIAIRAKAARGPKPGQRSGVRTRYLRVELDHDSGDMEGEVLEGPLQGRRLGDLALDDLLSLLDECRREEEASAAILETYLDRRFPDWRNAGAQGGATGGATGGEAGGAGERRAAPGGMTREEAYEILGLEPGASPEEIREAHRRLMLKMHPDRGGSSYLAARINQAKDVLTGT